MLVASLAWAFAFTRIYTQPHPRVEASRWIFQNIPGPINLRGQSGGRDFNQPLPVPAEDALSRERPFVTSFVAQQDGFLSAVYLPYVVDQNDAGNSGVSHTMSLSIAAQREGDSLASATVTRDFSPQNDSRGENLRIALDQPVDLTQGETYSLQFELQGPGELTFHGAALANESTWDDGLPLRIDGYDPFGGIYQGGLNFEMYWDDNQEKLQRFVDTLTQADYVLISSSRQWASTTRLPERYPLTTKYYRQLLGCPLEQSVEWCYTSHSPGHFRESWVSN